jgi:hypothetical protein
VIAVGTQQVQPNFEALTRAELTRLALAQAQQLQRLDQLVSMQQAIIDDLAKTAKPTLLGETSVTVPGALVSLSLATTRRWVNPFAGIKPGDFLQPVMSEYLPEGWGLPQLVCRNAGQLEIRVGVPQLAVGTPARAITFGVLALRTVPLA